MDDLIKKLQELKPEELDYVMARSSNNSIAAACKEADLSQSTVYRWENRDQLDELATALRLDRHIEVELKLRDALPDAVQTIIDGLNERRYDTKFKAAVEILDRTLGKSTQKQEINAKVDGEMVVNLSWDNDE
jgi:hypothetical protein